MTIRSQQIGFALLHLQGPLHLRLHAVTYT